MKAIIFDFNRTLYDPETRTLMDGCMYVLNKLYDNKKLAIIAKGNEKRKALIKSLGIEKFFEAIILEDEKTEEIFMDCIDSFGVKPREVFLVGDRIKKEITIGNKIGCITVWFRKGKFSEELSSTPEEKPTYTIYNLRSLLKIVR